MFKRKINLAVFGFMLFFVSAANAQNDIHKVDFNNFTYEIDDLSGEGKMKITVKDGKFVRENEDDRMFFSVMSVTYGDLDGDGKDEAVVTTILNTGGAGNFLNGQIFTIRNGKPIVLTEFEGGDRAYGGIVGAKTVDGLLVVERNSPGENGGACCPELLETTRYKWNGKTLAQVGAAESRELYPAARISFEKGTAMSVVRLKLKSGEIKRFVVGAREGQILRVASDAKSNDISYRLVRGDGDEKETARGITVRLKENGDYVFELSNNSEKDLNVSMTVQIN